MKGRAASFASLATSILLTGCLSGKFDQGEVQREWALTLRQLGIVPIFPPREDFVVGDIYVTNYDPESQETIAVFEKDFDDLTDAERSQRLSIGMSSRIHRMDLSEVISKEYAATFSGPPTTPDYNGILNNPALSAINSQIEVETAALNSLNQQLTDSKKAVTDATAAVTKATYNKEDADKSVTAAQAALTSARSRTQDVSSQEQSLANLQIELRTIEDALLRAQRNLADAGTDEALKAAAQREVTSATRAKEDKQTEISRLRADIDARKAIPVDVTAESQAVNQATANQTLAATALTNATREKTAKELENSSLIAELTPKITAATAKLEASKKVKEALDIAGAKFLYPQPQYTANNVFTGERFSLGADGKPVTDSRLNRLRIVGFPEFASTSITQGDLSALIPAEALSLNISASDVDRVVVKIPAAESYGLSFSTFFDEAFTEISVEDDYSELRFFDLSDELRDKLVVPSVLLVGFPNTNSRYVYFRFVTEVFYARAIDIGLFGGTAFGGLLEKVIAPGFNQNAEEESESTEEAQFGGVIDAAASGDGADLLATLRANLGREAAIPGGSVQLLNYSESSIGLRRVYDRPIAIGFRGVTVKYDLCANHDESEPFEFSLNCQGMVVATSVSASPVATATLLPDSEVQNRFNQNQPRNN